MKTFILALSILILPSLALAATGSIDAAEPTIAVCGTQDVVLEYTVAVDGDARAAIYKDNVLVSDEVASSGEFSHTFNSIAPSEERYRVGFSLYDDGGSLAVDVVTFSVDECPPVEEPPVIEPPVVSDGGGSRTGFERRNERLCEKENICTKDERDVYYWLRKVSRTLTELVVTEPGTPRFSELQEYLEELMERKPEGINIEQ